MPTIYVYQKCSTCRDALKWLDQKSIACEVKAIRETPPTPAELKVALAAVGGDLRKLFNTSGVDYRELGMKDKLPAMSETEAFEILSENGNLVKRPFLVAGEKVLVGFKEADWSAGLRSQPQNEQPSSSTSQDGLLIVLEGIDGTGKSTQVKRLGEWFVSQGREVVLSREPTSGPWGTKLRESAATGRLSPADELEYFLKDRRQHVEELIAPSLAAGKVVILDRYYFSTMAYQGARGFDPAEIRRRNEAFAPVPDLLLLMDLEVDLSLERIGGRGDVANEFEKRENLERCREIFRSLKDEPFARLIDSSGSLDEVTREMIEVVARCAADHRNLPGHSA